MDKSPINILQELLVKEGCVPKYSYILDVPDFKCEVTCKNLNAIGIGSNKKEAKHNAALNMLSLLNIPTHSKRCKTDSNIPNLRTSTCNINMACSNNQSNNANISLSLNTQMQPECNYIGLLQELSIQYHLDFPLYELIDESGPAHMKVFKVKCNVGSLEMTGIGHNKKSAKQEAAKNILQFLLISNMLPQETYKRIENFKNTFYRNNLQDKTMNVSDIKFTEPILPVKVSETTDISEKALTTYVESNPENKTMHNIAVDNNSMFSNHNTIKNTHTSIYQTKSIETVNNHELTLENNAKTSDIERSIVQSTLTKSSESVQSDRIKSNSNDTKEQNLLTTNDHAHLSSVLMNNNQGHERTIEDDLQKFNAEILDHVENKSILPLMELSKRALSAYVVSQAMEDTVRCKSTNA